MAIPLKHALRDHYEAFQLSPEELKRLARIQRKAVPRRALNLPILAGSVLVSALLLIVLMSHRWSQKDAQVRALASEVVGLQLERLPNTISGHSIAELRSQLPDLEFNLISSSHLPPELWRIDGARYCPLAGKRAVQLRLLHLPEEVPHALYQLPCPDTLSHLGIIPLRRFINGVEVRIWAEKGLLLVLAGP